MEERCGLDLSGSGYKRVKYSCEHNIENIGAVKRGEFLEQLDDYQFFKRDFFHRFGWVSYIIRSDIG